MNDWLTAICVIAAAAVSILSVFVPFFTERLGRKEEKADAQIKHIDETTQSFLKELLNFRHWNYESVKKMAGEAPVEHLYTDLQLAQYAWERAVWPQLSKQGREKAKEIRQRIVGVHVPDDLSRGPNDSDVPILADQILALTRTVNGRS